MQPYVQSIYCQDAPNLPLCPLSANATFICAEESAERLDETTLSALPIYFYLY